MTEPLLSLTELTKALGRPRGWIWRLASTGQIPCARIGRSYYFRLSAVEAWLASQATAPAPAGKASPRSLRDEAADFGLTADDLDAVN